MTVGFGVAAAPRCPSLLFGAPDAHNFGSEIKGSDKTSRTVNWHGQDGKKRMETMKVLAFAASNSRQSINRALVDHALKRFGDEFVSDLRVNLLDLNDFEMPIYSIDRESEGGIPAGAREFYEHIGSSDAVLVSFAEHNGTVTAAWKNIFDWMSRIDTKVWQGKPLAILAATPGPRAGAGVLQYAALASHFGGDIKGSLGVGQWSEAYDEQRRVLTRADDSNALGAILAALAA